VNDDDKIEITEELVEKYLAYKKEIVSEKYLLCAENILLNLQKIIAEKQPQEITPELLTEYLLLNRTVSRNALKTYLRYVKSYLNWLLGKNHKETINFQEYYRKLKFEIKELRIVEDQTIRKLLLNCKDNYRFLFWLACKIGARRTALTELNISNLHFTEFKNTRKYYHEESYLELEEIYGAESEACVIHFKDKHGGRKAPKANVIPLYPVDTMKLRKFLTIREETAADLKKKFNDQKGEFLFWNRKGERMDPQAISVQIINIRKQLAIDFQMHDTRRYAIDLWFRLGLRKEEVMVLSGHSSDAIDRYWQPKTKTVWGKLGKGLSEVQ